MDVGTRWAYRARLVEPLVEVELLRVGTKKPARVLVRFLADDAEGREAWVPPARLKVPWVEVESYREQKERWTAIRRDHPSEHDPASHAVETVFGALFDEAIAHVGYGADAGLAFIADVPALTELLGISESDLRTDERSFINNGVLVVPWPTALQVARAAASRDPERLLHAVDAEEHEYRRQMIYGKRYPGSRGRSDFFVAPERYVEELDEPRNKPAWDLLREWCGADAIAQADELAALRQEVRRIGRLMEEAITLLRAAGRTAEANRLERELGMPVEP